MLCNGSKPKKILKTVSMSLRTISDCLVYVWLSSVKKRTGGGRKNIWRNSGQLFFFPPNFMKTMYLQIQNTQCLPEHMRHEQKCTKAHHNQNLLTIIRIIINICAKPVINTKSRKKPGEKGPVPYSETTVRGKADFPLEMGQRGSSKQGAGHGFCSDALPSNITGLPGWETESGFPVPGENTKQTEFALRDVT